MFFMEVSCDLEELERLLNGDKKDSQWSMLEDFAIQTDPTSQEFEHVVQAKGLSQVTKRKKFLELL